MSLRLEVKLEVGDPKLVKFLLGVDWLNPRADWPPALVRFLRQKPRRHDIDSARCQHTKGRLNVEVMVILYV